MDNKSLSIILTVLGAAAGVWAFTRVTSLAGQLHTWQPPFTAYETTTLIGGGIAVVLPNCGLDQVDKEGESEQPGT